MMDVQTNHMPFTDSINIQKKIWGGNNPVPKISEPSWATGRTRQSACRLWWHWCHCPTWTTWWPWIHRCGQAMVVSWWHKSRNVSDLQLVDSPHLYDMKWFINGSINIINQLVVLILHKSWFFTLPEKWFISIYMHVPALSGGYWTGPQALNHHGPNAHGHFAYPLWQTAPCSIDVMIFIDVHSC